jgi:hypothetical protein
MREPSEKYFAALSRTQKHHAVQNKTFSGQFTWKQRKRIKPLIDRFSCKTMLDYGSGKGKQYDTAFNRDKDGKSLVDYFGIVPVMYDPGVPKLAAEPKGKFDLVICVQVLASIPTADLPWVIDRLYGYADKALFVTERIKAANKPIYRDIEADMPRSLSVDDWMALLRRPGSPVHLRAVFRSPDEKWKIIEPEDQGA